jgi:hypothetical protein
MVADLRWSRGVVWRDLDEEERAEVTVWWMMVRRYELLHLGVLDDHGLMRG